MAVSVHKSVAATRLAPDRSDYDMSDHGAAVAMQRVHVSLFGALAVHCRQRPLRVDVPAGATVAEVIDVLGRRLGSGFLDGVLEHTGEKFRYCRIFVDGLQVELDAHIPSGSAAPTVEFIVLTVFEGG
jgi:hypothetical protein